MTLSQIAKKLGMSVASVSRFASGNQYPDVLTIGDIADKFGWSREDQCRAIERGDYGSQFTRILKVKKGSFER